MLKKERSRIIAWCLILGVLISGLLAVPLKINYQGRLTNNNEPVNATKAMYFSIKETNSGTTVWGPVQQNINVVNGVYTATLEPPQAIFETSQQLQLHIKVETIDLSPDILLLSVPYAYIAKKAETITANQAAGDSIISALNAASKTVPSGALVGTSDTQSLTNKTISSGSSWTGNTIAISYGGTGSDNGSITGSGALNFTAGGSNQNITLAPSGTGAAVLNGNILMTGVSGMKVSSANNLLTFEY